MKWIIYISLMVLFISCNKEFTTLETTEITTVIEKDFFNDSIYNVKQFNVTSTNDSVLYYANARVLDDSTTTVLWEGAWRDLRHSTFSLPQRKNYKIRIELYRSVNNQEVIDYTTTRQFNNHKIPTKFQLISAEVDPSIIAIEDYYGLTAQGSNTRQVIIVSELSLESSTEDFEHNTVTTDYNYYQKLHSPRKLSYNFSNLYFDTKKMDNGTPKWMTYDIIFYYPIDFVSSGNFTEEFRHITFVISCRDRFDKNEVYHQIEYSVQNDPDHTSSGADYSGTLIIKWIYEN